MQTFVQDLRYAARTLRNSPGFTIVALVTLALGIGANTALFTVINALMLRPLPVERPGRLFQLFHLKQGGDSFSFPLYEKLRDGETGLFGLFAAGGIGRGRMVAGSASETEFVRGQPVTGNFFEVLGVRAAAGRAFDATDDRPGRAEPVVVLSHAFWTRRFASDPAVVGSAVTFNDVPVTVVGIMPKGFFGIQPGDEPDLWWPLQLVRRVEADPTGARLGEGYEWLRLMGRVPPGTDPVHVRAQLKVVLHQYLYSASMNTDPTAITPQQNNPDRVMRLEPAAAGWTPLRDRFREPLLILMAAVGMVLMIACANVAGLQLSRAVAREREFAVRSALGAGRLRLVRQLVTESLLLSAAGAATGLLAAEWGARVLASYMNVRAGSASFDLSHDGRVLAFTALITLVTGVLFGLAPALRGWRTNLAAPAAGGSATVAGGTARALLPQSLVVAQVALSLVLLIGAALFVRTLTKLNGMDMGFRREGVLLFDVEPAERLDAPRRTALYREVLARLEATPGVRSASASFITVLSGMSWGQQLTIEGGAIDPGGDMRCNGMYVAPRYFDTMGVPLLSGRDFGPQDEAPAPPDTPAAAARKDPATKEPAKDAGDQTLSAIVNESMAARFFGTDSPIGRRFSFSAGSGPMFEVIGIVKDVKHRSLRDSAPPIFYVSCFQQPRNWNMTFAVRTVGEPTALAGAVRQAVRNVDATAQVRDVRPLADVVNASLHQERAIAQLGGFFSIVALLLACVGLYGVLSFLVGQRTREIGVRMAVGARRWDVAALVVGKGLRLALVGLVIGAAAALAGGRVVSSFLYGVTAADPATFVGVSLLLACVAAAASWLPARRAARVDPMVALRHE